MHVVKDSGMCISNCVKIRALAIVPWSPLSVKGYTCLDTSWRQTAKFPWTWNSCHAQHPIFQMICYPPPKHLPGLLICITVSTVGAILYHLHTVNYIGKCVYVFMCLWGGLIFHNRLLFGPSPCRGAARFPSLKTIRWPLPQCPHCWGSVNTDVMYTFMAHTTYVGISWSDITVTQPILRWVSHACATVIWHNVGAQHQHMCMCHSHW